MREGAYKGGREGAELMWCFRTSGKKSEMKRGGG